ncbi:MAG: hypothetical protein WKF66_10835 [Pedobacter sp.]
MQTGVLSAEDLELIDNKIRPKHKKYAAYVFLGLLLVSTVSPFFSGRWFNNRPSAYEQGRYPSGFMIAMLIFMPLALYFYYRIVICLNRDVKDGTKYIVQVPILSKKMIDDSNYEVVLDRGKLNIDKIVTIPKRDVYKWIKNDLVEVHFLKRSGTVLSYKTES